MILYEIRCHAEIREAAGISSYMDVPYSGVRHRTRKGAAEELAKAQRDGAHNPYISEVEVETWVG